MFIFDKLAVIFNLNEANILKLNIKLIKEKDDVCQLVLKVL